MLPFLSLTIGELGKRTRDEPLIASAEEAADALDRHGTRDELDEAMSSLNAAGRIRDALATVTDGTNARALHALVNLKRAIAATTRAVVAHLREQGDGQVVVFDLESTHRIVKSIPFDKMEVSVACATVLYTDTLRNPRNALEMASSYTFWHRDVDGAPVALLLELLRSARLIVAYNGISFDLNVLKPFMCDEDELVHLQSKCLDPFTVLRGITGRFMKLSDLLSINGLAPKTASGALAPTLWEQRRYAQLAAYCARDVSALAELVLLPRARLSDVATTTDISLYTALGIQPAPEDAQRVDTTTLVQGSDAWFEARRGLITASLAPALLQLSPFTTRADAFERLLGAPGPTVTEHQRRGTATEAGIVRLYCEERRVEPSYVHETGIWRHPRVSWLAASPDRLMGDSMLIEAKSTSRIAAPSPAFVVQVMIQMACTKRYTCDLVQYDYRKNKLRIDRIRFDDDLFRLIYKQLEQVAAAAADARALGAHHDDAHIAPMEPRDLVDLRDEIGDVLKTHSVQLL